MIEFIVTKLRQVLPGRPVMIALLAAFSLGVLVSTGNLSCRKVPDDSTPTPSAPLSSKGWNSLGQTYTANLGKVYASAWESGAAALEKGQPVSSALETVRSVWERDRTQLFNKSVAGEFAKVVPQGKDDATISADERAALAKAWRAFAAGLRR